MGVVDTVPRQAPSPMESSRKTMKGLVGSSEHTMAFSRRPCPGLPRMSPVVTSMGVMGGMLSWVGFLCQVSVLVDRTGFFCYGTCMSHWNWNEKDSDARYMVFYGTSSRVWGITTLSHDGIKDAKFPQSWMVLCCG